MSDPSETIASLGQDVANLCMELRLQKIPVEDRELRIRAADMIRFLYDRMERIAAASADLRTALVRRTEEDKAALNYAYAGLPENDKP